MKCSHGISNFLEEISSLSHSVLSLYFFALLHYSLELYIQLGISFLFSFEIFDLGYMGFPGGSEVKASACNVGDLGLIPGLGRFPWRRKRKPTPVFLPGESHGQRNLVGYSPRGRKESDTPERVHFHFHTWTAQQVSLCYCCCLVAKLCPTFL